MEENYNISVFNQTLMCISKEDVVTSVTQLFIIGVCFSFQ